jgi:hypothetical protein
VQCLRGAYYAAAPKLQWQILSELGMLAQPPLGLIGLVQPSFLKMCNIVQSTEANSDVSMDMSCFDRSTFLATAALATNGDQRGSKHGCLLIDEQNGKVMGEGWNHEVVEQRGGPQRRRVLHAEVALSCDGPVLSCDCLILSFVLSLWSSSHFPGKYESVWCDISLLCHQQQVMLFLTPLTQKVHAVADAIRRHGEQNAFAIFKRCSAWIVELRDDAAYDDAPPCPKCLPLLQSIGVPRVVHSTRTGKLARVQLPREKPDLFSLPMACKPLSYACDELGVRCERLELALVSNNSSNNVK